MSSRPASVSHSAPPNPVAVESKEHPAARRIGERYVVQEELGRGGMAVVYRVLDLSSDRPMALKQLLRTDREKHREAMQSLFESEFRTLAELEHPRVIQVDDYGIDAEGPYYTMELLDGGNLTQRAPVPWREACALLHDVCSSLALLHARRLLHRDVSPHNVRCTSSGRAKLIDFGAMVPMGPCEQAVGTPAFVAPEIAQRGTLDARTDLFSLGATLYFALTARPAYPARSFDQLLDVWSRRPVPPSAYDPDVPPALDTLVMGLLSLDPSLRPRSAFEVMSQLHALAGLGEREVIDVARVYLAAPQLLGREKLLEKVQRRTTLARVRRGRGVLIDGPPGAGRSRALDAALLQAKLAGLTVVRADAHRAGRHAFALVTHVLQQLIRLAPESSMTAALASEGRELLFDIDSSAGSLSCKPLSDDAQQRLRVQQALTGFCSQLARRCPIGLAIDDIDDADEPSMAWLASLAELAKRERMLLLYTARSASVESSAQPAVKVIAEHCSRYTLAPFTLPQLEMLCGSIFGDVPYVHLCADRVYRVAAGNARASMDLLRHLVDHELIRYEAGTWILPEKLEASALPASMDESYADRFGRMSATARWLAQAHALSSYVALHAADHAGLVQDGSEASVEDACAELIEHGVLTGTVELALSHAAWKRASLQALAPADRALIHRKLAALGPHPLRPALAIAYHLQCGGEHVQALQMLANLPVEDEPIRSFMRLQLSLPQVSAMLQQSLETGEKSGSSEYVVNQLRRMACGLTIATHGREYERLSPAWLSSLRRDVGLDDWDALADVTEPGARLMQALTRTSERFNATPEHERGYRPDLAIRQLINYVVVSIAIASRTFDAERMRSLPALLQPYVALSPIIDAVYQNALATYEYVVEGRIQRARERWLGVLERIQQAQGDALEYVGPIRGAVAYAVGVIEIVRGYATASRWADVLDGDVLQQVNAMYLRRVARLQVGDAEGAERLRRKAELLAVTSNSHSMFDSMLVPELIVFSLAADLSGLQHVYERLKPVAERQPAWTCYERLACAQLALLHGAYTEALAHTEHALAYSEPDASNPRRCSSAWPWVVSARCHALLGMGRHHDARELASRVLDECLRRGMDATEELTRVLSLAEARLGDYATASRRLDALRAQQEAAEIVGINIGATYEARTRIAIWAGDRAAIEQYGQLTAAAYAHGKGSPLGARYERLRSEAEARGVTVQLALTDFETSMFGTTFARSIPSATAALVVLRSAATADERADRALRLVCEATGARAGELHLITATGMRVAAALGDAVHTDAYSDLARQCLEDAQAADDGATQFARESVPATSNIHRPQTSITGPILQRAILLTGEANDSVHHVGVVVVDASARSVTTREQHSLLRAIASHLLGAGDSPGMPVNDA